MSRKPPNPTPQDLQAALAAWRAQVAQAQNPWLAAILLKQWERFLRRVVYYYRQLRALPRKARRAWQKKLATTLAGAALLLALAGPLAPPVHAATITVDGTTCTLAEAITSANNDNAAGNGCVDGSGADTITLQTDVTLTSALPNITSQITIEGNGHTIDGNNGVYHVLYVANTGDLTLNNATITGGNANGSGSDGNGGGIFNDGMLTVTNSTISGNSAKHGGGIYNHNGTVTVSNSTISSNTASGDGGGIDNEDTLTMNNSTISGNSATNKGGGIYNNYMATVSNSAINGNSAYYGGGIYNHNGTVTVSNSTISSNTASGDGGGIDNEDTLTVNNSTISGNSANLGGGIYNGDTLTVTNSTISGNSATNTGGGIYSNYMATVSNSAINGNSANNSFGGGIHNYGDMTVTNSTISGNRAFFGGGIFNDSMLTVTNSTISRNSATTNGGGICNGDTLTVTNSTISGNSATFGGGIFSEVGTATVSNSTISGNRGVWGGGGIKNLGTLTLNRSLISGNTAASSGNEIYNSDTFNANNYNLFGHSGENSGQAFDGFTPCSGAGCTDITATSDGTNVALASILNPVLALNGGQTKTHSLVDGSPALDAIPAGSCGGLTQDQRGFTRPVNTNCDIGAFELQSNETSYYANSFPATNIGGTNVSVTQVNSGSPGQVNVLKRAGVYPGGSQTSGEFPVIWVLTATGSSFDVKLRLCYTAAELTSSGVTDENTITAYRWDETSGSWVAQATTPDPVNNCVDVNNVTAFSPWTLVGDGNTPTAVTLQSLTASSRGSSGGLAAVLGAVSLALGGLWLRRRKS
ncbi:beta strand repeat-containing protein [Ardenticatena maritima]|uniref:Right handed beta helix domain-containing protein n=1 Tax=Ardenticatena maritima TaxID=872965 RepID=A0A0P6Y0U4_9CHLR|nr:choice-of-anchor Q domain-containing protein [Ardenticatena maritima]KPL89513.1 hypothetical protein SE16_03540 [Ardenticatena maritima]